MQGEGDGLPTHGEPNFDETDKDESDQIGLTAVALNVLSRQRPDRGLAEERRGDVAHG